MSTGAIIAIAVLAAIVLVALFVVVPRMRRSAAERRLNWERQKRAEEHRERAKLQQTRADLAEQEARKQRAEAEIHAKRAELHEHGLADHELESGPTAEDPVAEGRDTDRLRDQRTRDEATLDDPQGGGRYRDLSSGGRAHEPEPTDDTGERRFVRRDEREGAVADAERRTVR